MNPQEKAALLRKVVDQFHGDCLEAIKQNWFERIDGLLSPPGLEQVSKIVTDLLQAKAEEIYEEIETQFTKYYEAKLAKAKKESQNRKKAADDALVTYQTNHGLQANLDDQEEQEFLQSLSQLREEQPYEGHRGFRRIGDRRHNDSPYVSRTYPEL